MTWNQRLLSMLGNCLAVAVAPSNSDIVYAGGSSYSGYPWFFKTTDRGVSWDTLSGLNGDSVITALAVHPIDPSIVYAGKSNGVFRSTNGGATWTNTGLNNVSSIIIDPICPETVYAGTGNGAYISATGGGGWTQMNDGLDCLAITGMDIDIERNLYASTNGSGMYRWQMNTAAEEREQASGKSRLGRACPNPSRGNVRIDYSVGRNGKAGIVIHDVQGRLVRTLKFESTVPGSGTALWDGRDDHGRPVASGVYFCRLVTTGEAECVRTLVILR